MRSVPRLLVLLGLLLAALGAPPARAAAPHIVVKDGKTQPVFSYVDAVRETVYVQSSEDQDKDGKLDLLATDIIRPKETKAGLKVPVIYEMSPYYQQSGRGNESQVKKPADASFSPSFFPLFFDNYFVPRGYAVVLQDMRGTRNSEGCTVTGGSDEVRDTASTIQWLTGKGKAFTASGTPVKADWSTGHVGMIGKSYDGSVANGAASSGVAGLDAIVPVSAISRWYDYAGSNGVQYTNAALTPVEFELDPSLGRNMPDDTARAASTMNTVNRFGPVCTAVSAEVVAGSADPTSVYNAYWDDRDYLRNVNKVHAAVFLIHGLNDTNVKPDNYVNWFTALAAHGVPRKIWLHQGSHVDPFDIRRAAYVEALHGWFDRWLQKIPNDIMKQPMADVEQTPGHWITEATWPAPGARPVTYVMSGGSLQPGTRGTGTASFTDDPTASESNLATSPDTSQAARVAFTTPALTSPLHLSGKIQLSLKGSVNNADTHFTGLLVDYPPAGKTVTALDYNSSGEGLANSTTKSCWGASSQGDSACYIDTHEVKVTKPFEVITHGFLDAAHHVTLRQLDPLIPGTSYQFSFNLFGDDYVLPAGHKLGLIIAGSDVDTTIPSATHATTTLDLTGSTLTLPVVTGLHGDPRPPVTVATPRAPTDALPATGLAPALAAGGLMLACLGLLTRRRVRSARA